MLVLGGCADGPPSLTEAAHAGNTVTVTDDNFAAVVLAADKPVMVDFWASWCGPCRQIAPLVSELSVEYGDRAILAKLDVDEAGETAAQYDVQAIPTLIVFKNGKEIDRITGTVPKTVLQAALDKAL